MAIFDTEVASEDKAKKEEEGLRPKKKLKMALAALDVGLDNGSNDKGTSDDTVWCINNDKFLMEMRTEVIVDYVSSRLDATAGVIVRSMMASNEPNLAARPGKGNSSSNASFPIR